MNLSDDIKQFLPKYLSPESSQKLFAELEQFPGNINDSLYSYSLIEDQDVFQGDGIRNLPIVNLPVPGIKEGPVMVLSNTCDTSVENERTRIYKPRLIYCPIIKLSGYIEFLKTDQGLKEEQIATQIQAIKRQEISTFFFLPEGAGLPEDCLAMLDRANNCQFAHLKQVNIKEARLFSLSNFGFYLFIFKLSIHLTRIREAIDRK